MQAFQNTYRHAFTSGMLYMGCPSTYVRIVTSEVVEKKFVSNDQLSVQKGVRSVASNTFPTFRRPKVRHFFSTVCTKARFWILIVGHEQYRW